MQWSFCLQVSLCVQEFTTFDGAKKRGAHFVAKSKRYVHNPQDHWLQRVGVRAFLPIYSRFSLLFFYPLSFPTFFASCE